MDRKRQRKPRDAMGAAAPIRLEAPKERMEAYLGLPQQVATTAESEAFSLPLPETTTERMLRQFDMSVLVRGTNALKAVRLLCGEGFWEFAAPIVRQLFELVLNMEHLAAQPDREAQVLRYVKFGLLQRGQRRLDEFRYDEKTGRPVDSEAMGVVEAVLRTGFQEFRSRKPDRWADHWSGKTTRALVDESSREIRRDQYRLLYRDWSDQAHGSPAALLESIFPSPDVQQIVATDDTRIAEAVALAINLFLELHELLPTLPPLPLELQQQWLDELIKEAEKHGAVRATRPSSRRRGETDA